MNQIVTLGEVESKILELRGQQVILDGDVAQLYQVETRDINKAVKNNVDKFPEGYIITLSKDEKETIIADFDRFHALKHSTALPKAFTEKGLYMLATILKSERATLTTISIIETFTRVREIGRTVLQLPTIQENTPKHQALVQRAGELISDLIVPEELATSESEASIELNFVVAKLKYSIKKKSKK